MRVVVLGAGFGGLELATKLSETLDDICYLEFGNEEVARVTVRFLSGQAPIGTYEAPSVALAEDKMEFGSSRIQRWFGREWNCS
jgi:NADH dehydrogenase FAD-containing subunit